MAKRYTDREVSLILQRALEPSADQSGADLDGHGISLEQLKSIAAEVGIDPARIELAASSLLETVPAQANPYVGIPTTVEFQTMFPGLDIAKVRHDAVALIQSTLGRHGIVNHDAGTLEWHARDGSGGRYVSLTPSRDGARLRVLGNYRNGLAGAAATIGMAGFVIGAALLDGLGLGSTVTLLGSAAIAAVPPRFAYRWWRKKEDARMAELHGKLVALLNASASPDAKNHQSQIANRKS